MLFEKRSSESKEEQKCSALRTGICIHFASTAWNFEKYVRTKGAMGQSYAFPEFDNAFVGSICNHRDVVIVNCVVCNLAINLLAKLQFWIKLSSFLLL